MATVNLSSLAPTLIYDKGGMMATTEEIAFDEMMARFSTVTPGRPLWVSLVNQVTGYSFVNLWTCSDEEAPASFIQRMMTWAEETLNDPDNESMADYATVFLRRIFSEAGDHVDVVLEDRPLADVSWEDDIRLTLFLAPEEIEVGLWNVSVDKAGASRTIPKGTLTP